MIVHISYRAVAHRVNTRLTSYNYIPTVRQKNDEELRRIPYNPCGIISQGDFMNRIRETMKEQKITQVELQELTGIRQNVISRIINEGIKTSISLETARKFAKALNVSIEYLFPG